MSDLISRQAAINAIKALWNDAISAQQMSAMFDCEDAIRALPSAEPQWIPVSEKLPKYSDDVLVWVCDNEIDIGAYFCDTWHIHGCGSAEDGIIIAWMPLPEPYEEKK